MKNEGSDLGRSWGARQSLASGWTALPSVGVTTMVVVGVSRLRLVYFFVADGDSKEITHYELRIKILCASVSLWETE